MTPDKQPNKFEATFSKNVGKHLTIYMKNGRAMPGILRSHSGRTVRIDTPNGVEGGTEIDCDDISTVSVK